MKVASYCADKYVHQYLHRRTQISTLDNPLHQTFPIINNKEQKETRSSIPRPLKCRHTHTVIHRNSSHPARLHPYQPELLKPIDRPKNNAESSSYAKDPGGTTPTIRRKRLAACALLPRFWLHIHFVFIRHALTVQMNHEVLKGRTLK